VAVVEVARCADVLEWTVGDVHMHQIFDFCKDRFEDQWVFDIEVHEGVIEVHEGVIEVHEGLIEVHEGVIGVRRVDACKVIEVAALPSEGNEGSCSVGLCFHAWPETILEEIELTVLWCLVSPPVVVVFELELLIVIADFPVLGIGCHSRKNFVSLFCDSVVGPSDLDANAVGLGVQQPVHLGVFLISKNYRCLLRLRRTLRLRRLNPDVSI